MIITVEDTTPPEITLTLSMPNVWPPNHKMALVAAGISASDICDPDPVLTVEVTSNEPVNGIGDGNTEPDWSVEQNPDGSFGKDDHAYKTAMTVNAFAVPYRMLPIYERDETVDEE